MRPITTAKLKQGDLVWLSIKFEAVKKGPDVSAAALELTCKPCLTSCPGIRI